MVEKTNSQQGAQRFQANPGSSLRDRHSNFQNWAKVSRLPRLRRRSAGRVHNHSQEKAKDLQLTNIEFISGRAEDVILDGAFDCITSSYLAKYADLDRLIENARAMLRV